jgi:hypothetical protein
VHSQSALYYTLLLYYLCAFHALTVHSLCTHFTTPNGLSVMLPHILGFARFCVELSPFLSSDALIMYSMYVVFALTLHSLVFIPTVVAIELTLHS